MIVSLDTDELQLYSDLKNKHIKFDSTLRLVIAPTLDCNFRCPYCFEKHTPEYMSDDIQNKLLDFAEDRLKTGNYMKLLVCWYGGEPLLGVEIIKNLSKKLYDLCQRYSVLYWSYMVTNGYLLEQYADTLRECNVKEI